MREGISEPAKRRLVLLEKLLSTMEGRVTSNVLSEMTGWKDTLIRHDIFCTGFKDGVSNGYDVKSLQKAIRHALFVSSSGKSENAFERNGNGELSSESHDTDERDCKRCCIVGLGRLGSALLDEQMFLGSGFKIVAGFDPNVNRTEILRSTFPLYPASKMETIVSQQKIQFALLASKNTDAVLLAKRLVRCGILGIVNYTDETLVLPKEVVVENASPVTSLRMLLSKTT
ncbi:MAG: Gfo/Idh/MocA family oxidoreductase [Treponema sp.]|nr:Gfo/Idh/MocA family oxidoreductase [Treponema sp.]